MKCTILYLYFRTLLLSEELKDKVKHNAILNCYWLYQIGKEWSELSDHNILSLACVDIIMNKWN